MKQKEKEKNFRRYVEMEKKIQANYFTTLEGIFMLLGAAMKWNMKEAEVVLVAAAADDKIKTIGDLLFELGCLMRKQDIEGDEYVADESVKELKRLAELYQNSPVAKALNTGVVRWLTSHGGSTRRYLETSSKQCDGKGYGTATKKKTKLREEMPAYLLNAITNEKPVHPVYGKLRY